MTARPAPRFLAATDFKRQARVPASSLPGAARLGTRLAGSCTAVLGQFGSSSWRVALDAIEDVPAANSEPDNASYRYLSSGGLLSLEVSFDRSVLSAVIEIALGGTGGEEPYEFPDRPLSRIEGETQKLIFARLAEEFERTFTTAFERSYSRVLTGGSGGTPEDSTERVVFRFIVNVFSYSGEVRVAFLREGLMACLAAGNESPDKSKTVTSPLQREISKADATLTVTLGPEVLLVEELAALKPGHHVRLASTAGTPVVIWCDGTRMLQAKLARAGDKLAVSVIGPAG